MERWGPIIVDPGRTPGDQVFFSSFGVRDLDSDVIESIVDSRHHQISQAGYALECSSNAAGQVRDKAAQSFDFSAGLTPILQHRLFPAVAIVAGPRQLDCLAQAMPLFDYFGLQPPVVWPQVTATLLDARSRKLLEKYHLSLEQLFTGPEALLRKLMDDSSASDPVERFQRLQTEVGGLLDSVVAALPPEDKSLSPVVDTSRSKILYQLSRLQERFVEARTLRREAMGRHLDRLCSSLAPEGQLQESIGGVEFLLRYSRNLLPELYDKIDVWSHEHQIIPIG
jgi:uncharacterized protein YllA (UPF0747 family)